MGSETSADARPLPLGRLAGVGLIVFFANAALLVLQLVAGRLLAPFVGSSLETWTSVIGVFLTGIALGNALGGRIADRYPSSRTLAALLACGALAALWMVGFPLLLDTVGAHKSIPLGPRIPLLALVLCLPAGFVLSLLTPLAIKLGLPDVSRTGRIAGMVFSLSTLGCLLGNYLTGFVLMKSFTINTLVYLSAGSLGLLALWALFGLKAAAEMPEATSGVAAASAENMGAAQVNPLAFTDIRLAYVVVFLASFGGMTLELTASRVLAQYLGVSLFTWTGIIGVMLAGTALGNLLGGMIADRVNRPGTTANARSILGASLILAAAGTVSLFVTLSFVQQNEMFEELGPIAQVMGWTFSLFFLPMLILGTISPQVIRLAVPDLAHVGRVAGRVYAWSTAGAIVGTFAAGYILLSTLGWKQTLLAVSLLLTLTSLLVARVWDSNPMLYLFSIVLGAVTGGFILTSRATNEEDLLVQKETNYYTIKVTWEYVPARDESGTALYARSGRMKLTLDHLLHSTVDPDNPDYLHYPHEHVQMEFLRAARAENPVPRVLVIGGGGYTFPRYAMEMLPETRMDVVEIDPGVTEVAREYLGLKSYEGMQVTHMDGRQFVAEKVPPGTYDLVIQDAVNDLSVPSHLLTKEYNDAVKRAMKPNGVYLLTVIDAVGYGKLWKAAVHTLGKSYPPENISLLTPGGFSAEDRQVYVIYASDRPLNLESLRAAAMEQLKVLEPPIRGFTARAATTGVSLPGGVPHVLLAVACAQVVEPHPGWVAEIRTFHVPPAELKPYLDAEPPIILTDQFAPTDNLMADVFRYRYRNRPSVKHPGE
jgi:spermidine synthase/MFS family permease